MSDLPSVDRVAVHLVDPRGRGTVLSHHAIEAPPPALERWLGALIAGCSADRHARDARFEDPAAAARAAQLRDRDGWLAASRDIAERLSGIAAQRRVAPGLLVVARFRARAAADGAVAVFKLDPHDAVGPITRIDAEGRPWVDFGAIPDVVPVDPDAVQKAAFLGPDGHLRVLDRQARHPGEVAGFFVSDLLGARLALDDAERTRRLYRALLKARNRLSGAQSEAERLHLAAAGEAALRGARFDLVALLDLLALPADQKASVDAIVRAELPDLVFDVDPDTAGRLGRRRAWVADGGLRVAIDADRGAEVSATPLADGRWRIEIVAAGWHEVPG